jgi:hypothetical protein
MFRSLMLRVCVLILPLWPTTVFADDPVVAVECLCVSPDGKMAIGLTAQTWEDLSPIYSDILQHNMVLILAPSERPSDRQKQACAKWAEIDENDKTPYVSSADPIMVTYGGMLKFTLGSTYQTAVRGSTLQ